MKFRDRIEKLISDGMESSQAVFQKAKEKTQELGEKGALKFETARLEAQAEKRFAKLGALVFEVLVEKGQETISKKTPAIRQLIDELTTIDARIEEIEGDEAES